MNSVQDQKLDDISLRLLWDLLWGAKWAIVLSAVAGLAIAGAFILLSPRVYEAYTVLAPVQTQAGGGQLGELANAASQFSGLASLAGVSVQTDSAKWESFAYLQSQALAQNYIREANLLPLLREHSVRMRLPSFSGEEDTPWEVMQDFRNDVLSIGRDGKSSLVTLSVHWTEPERAAEWANGIVKLTNETLRARAIETSEAHIAYLREQALKTDSIELRQAIYSLLLAELRGSMIARGNAEFAFKVIDPAVAAEKFISPRPILWSVIGVFLAVGACVAIVLGRAAFMRS